MADAKTNYLEQKMLDHALGTATFTKPTSVYVSLHTADPTDAQSGYEVTGGSYARKVAAFSAATTDSAGVTTASNTADVVWAGMPSTTITHIGIWDALTDGNMLYSAPLTTGKTIASGDGYTISTAQLVVSEN